MDEDENDEQVNTQQIKDQKVAAAKLILSKGVGRIHDAQVMMEVFQGVVKNASDEVFQETFINEGLITTATDAMQTHADNAAVLQVACQAIQLDNYKYQYNPNAEALITTAMTVPTLLNCVKKFPDSAELCKQACRALGVCCTGQLNRELLVAEDGMSIVLECVQRHQFQTQLPF
eukprot:TRINITY_DN93876_c0_g1_i1.p1 TRINITY_DN93876_c0_g1~~TRINITY_DN93876_c0_g1_i1.p1  ORF type:complete len:175 (-),score=33.52 TRINITY_DN93876_c0_g1_i1:145-669(-)